MAGGPICRTLGSYYLKLRVFETPNFPNPLAGKSKMCTGSTNVLGLGGLRVLEAFITGLGS